MHVYEEIKMKIVRKGSAQQWLARKFYVYKYSNIYIYTMC